MKYAVGFYSGAIDYKKITYLKGFLKGLKKFGYSTNIKRIRYFNDIEKEEKIDLCVSYGCKLQILSNAKVQNVPVITIFDHAIRANTVYKTVKDYRNICWNSGINNGYYYQNDLPDDRWKILKEKYQIEVKPWREKGEHIVIAHTKTIKGLRHRSFFYESIIKKSIKTGKKVYVCIKPIMPLYKERFLISNNTKAIYKKLGCDVISGGSIQKFNNAYCLFTAGGTTSVKATIDGIPSYTYENNITDFLYNNKNVDVFLKNPPTPYRTKWLNWAAYQQWTVDEMKQGLAFDYLLSIKNRVLK